MSAARQTVIGIAAFMTTACAILAHAAVTGGAPFA